MSALAAFVSLSGIPAPEGLVARMLAPMARRGPDGTATWTDGPAALGHAALHATPEARLERQPLVAGALALVSDARLDERDALHRHLRPTLAALGLDADVVPDAALLLAAHVRWGTDAPAHLTGDFVYAVWDASTRRLVAARDRLGVRQLFVRHVPGAFVALATEPDALLAPPPRPPLDEARLADAVTGRLYDPRMSLYAGIEKVPAAHTLTADGRGLHTSRYWTLDIGTPPPGDAADAFADAFETAVRRCARTDQALGAELSGGMDSSAVTLVAADVTREAGRPLHTFSARFSDTSGSDEHRYIDAVLARAGDHVVPHEFHPEAERFVELHDEIFDRVSDGRINGNHHFNYLSLRAAHHAGVRVLLTGQDGDTTVGHGWLLFSELAEAEQWDRFRDEARRCIEHLDAERGLYRGQIPYTSVGQIAANYALPVFRLWAETGQWRRLWRGTREAHRALGIPYGLLLRLLRRDLLRSPRTADAVRRRQIEARARRDVSPVLRPDLVARTDLVERLATRETERTEADRTSFSTAEAQQRMLSSLYLEGSFEKLDRYAGAWGVEARHPFMDVDLVELCLSLPTDEKLRDGFTRSVMRRGLATRLPEAITWRANKADLGVPHASFLFTSAPEQIDALLADLGPAEAYLDPDALADLWRRRDTLDDWSVVWLTNALGLALWLRRRAGADETVSE